MAWDFRPGMRVVCVEDDWIDRLEGASYPKKGKVYTVRAIFWSERKRRVYIRLSEIVNAPLAPSGMEPVFDGEAFRPLDERRIDCFRAHLAPRNVEIAA